MVSKVAMNKKVTGKNVTMSDIAKDLGVSTVTVSKAITGKEGVSKGVREKIVRRASEMGYMYSRGAREETTEKQFNIGILIGEGFFNDDAFYSRMYQRIVMELTKLGNFGMLEIVTRKAERQQHPPKIITNQKVDGLILLGQMNRKYIDMVSNFGLPLVLLDFYDEEGVEDSVIGDNVYGACRLTRYLIAQGHTKIGFIGSYLETSSILDRYIGFYKAMVQMQLPINQDWVLADRDAEGRYLDIEFPKEMPTAFFCNCDEVAFNVIKKLKKLGYQVPEDVSVVGFDNYIHAELSSPQITTFGVDLETMVQKAVDIIIKKVQSDDYSVGRIVVSGDLYLRNSVKKLTNA